MSKKVVQIISGCILEDEDALTLAELCRTCHATAETVTRMVDHGVITPQAGNTSRQWRFHRSTLVRADKALRLKRDLGVNMAGAALALELLDELNQLQRKLNHLESKW